MQGSPPEFFDLGSNPPSPDGSHMSAGDTGEDVAADSDYEAINESVFYSTGFSYNGNVVGSKPRPSFGQ